MCFLVVPFLFHHFGFDLLVDLVELLVLRLLVVGLVTAFLLTLFGPALTQQNPLFTYVALISPGIFIGLFIAGLIGLRPDRNQVIQTVRHAVRFGKVALVINLEKSQSSSKVSQLLKLHTDKVVESIR